MTKRLKIAAMLLLLGAQPAFDQTVTATLVGVVTDATGARVPGATVTATNKATNIARTVRTDAEGGYTIPLLPPGAYHVQAEQGGFKRTVVDGIELQVDQTARVDMTLQVGELAEAVQVEATAAMVASETSSVGHVINANQIQNLPLQGRMFYELAQLAPGTVPRWPTSFIAGRRPTPGGLDAPAISVGGGREEANGYLIDGIDAQDPHYQTPSIFPSVDVIQEFKLQSNAYSAEFGRFATQVNATTRSGTNALHGSAYEFMRNDVLDAASFFANFTGAGKAPLRYNQFGTTLGGPLVLPALYHGRDRTFFFVNYEGTRVRRGKVSQFNVPVADQRNGDFSVLNYRNNRPIFDPATTRPNPAGGGAVRDAFPGNRIPAARMTEFARAILSLYPLPNLNTATGNNFVAQLNDISDNNQGMARLDHRFDEKNSMWFRYSFFDGVASNKSPIDQGGTSTDNRAQNMGLNYLRILRADTLYELRLGYNRPTYLILQDGAFQKDYATLLGFKNLLRDSIGWGVPNVTLTGFSGIGTEGNPTTQVTNVYQVINHISLVRGAHSLKAGAEGRRTNYNDRSERYVRGQFGFQPAMTADPQRRSATGVSLADFFLGLPLTASGSATSLAANLNAFSYAFFVQDDWKIGRRLTLNLGLRYEYNQRYTDVQDRMTLFDSDYPGGRLLLSNTSQAYIPGRGLVDGPATPRGLLPADGNNWAPRVGLAFRPFNDNRTAVRMGYGIFYSMLQLEDVRSWVRNPPFGEVITLRTDQDANSSSPDALRVAELFPARGAPTALPDVYAPTKSFPEPYYQQWNFSIDRELPGRILLETGYMGSKGTRLTQRFMLNQARLDPDPSRPTNILSRRPYPLFGTSSRADEPGANSTYHAFFVKAEKRLAHGFSFLGTYTYSKSLDGASKFGEQPRDIYNKRLNKGRSSFDLRHRVVLSGTWELPFGPGRPYLARGIGGAVLGGWQFNAISSFRTGFPFSVAASGDVCNCGGQGQLAQQVGDPWEGAVRTREVWFDTAAFAQPARGTFGSSGRNILDGPGSVDLDVSLFRNIALGERAKVQVRGEFFNVLNHTNFGQPGATVATTGYGIIQSASGSRTVQLGLKVSF